jgi:DNA-binding transcriptional LysR family regulator
MRLAGIDLNLLTALDALLDESNVTKAASRLGVSQPAASHALGRLRELLGDPLLVRTPAGMQLTPRAAELRPALRAALAAAEVVLQAAPVFDPATAERTFVATIPDQAGYLLLPAIANRLAAEAPRVRLELRPAVDDLERALGTGEVELVVARYRDAPPPSLRERPLWTERFACVVRKGSAAARGPLDLDRYLSVRHVVVSPNGTPGSLVDDELGKLGVRRHIAMVIPQFLIAPAIVATSDLMWTAPLGVARAFADQLPLTIREPPLELPRFEMGVRWHVRLDRDPGLAWLRGVVDQVCAPLRGAAR